MTNGRVLIQRHPEKFEGWANKNLMRFSKQWQKVLLWGRVTRHIGTGWENEHQPFHKGPGSYNECRSEHEPTLTASETNHRQGCIWRCVENRSREAVTPSTPCWWYHVRNTGVPFASTSGYVEKPERVQ